MPEETVTVPEGAPFLIVLATAEEGRLSDELDANLKKLIAGLHEQHRNAGGKPKGAIMVAFQFTLDSGIVEVVAKLKVDLPKPVRTKSIFFGTPEGDLQRQNPRQAELPFRDTATEGVRDIRTAR